MDVNCGTYLYNYTKSSVQKKKLAVKQIDRALQNLFAVRMRLGLFDGNPITLPHGNISGAQVCSKEHQELDLEAALHDISSSSLIMWLKLESRVHLNQIKGRFSSLLIVAQLLHLLLRLRSSMERFLDTFSPEHSITPSGIFSNRTEAEKQYEESSKYVKWYKERVSELEMKLASLQEVSKLVELYKESSEEVVKKAGELEGVIKAMEIHLSQLQNEHKANVQKELALRKEAEKKKFTLLKHEMENDRYASFLDRLEIYKPLAGGDITTSLALYDTLKSLKNDIGTHCIGFAYNMPAFILAGGEKGNRTGMPLSRVFDNSSRCSSWYLASQKALNSE